MSWDKVFCRNRKARHEYEILDTLECGIMLQGVEVKSIRNGKMSLDGSYARIENGEVFLHGSNIQEYENKDLFTKHDPTRKRKLLLRKREINKFAAKADQQGLTLIPLSVYSTKGRMKVELAVARGKKLHDKRQALKEKDAKREMGS